MSFSYADDLVQDIHIRGIATGNMDIPKVIIEDTSSGNLKAYRLHDLVNGYEIVDIQQKGIFLKKGDEEVRVSLSNRISFALENEQHQEIGEPQFFTIQRNQVDTGIQLEQIIRKQVSDVEKIDYGPVGVKVVDTEEGNFMNIMGIETGDVIVSFNDAMINHPKDLENAIEKLLNTGDGSIWIGYERDGDYNAIYGTMY